MTRHWIRALARGLAVLTLTASASSAALASYSQVVFFGDSLSDTGNLYATNGVPVSPPYYNGQFSNGPVWTSVFANALGFSATPSIAGGNNYAWAGATVMDYGRPTPEVPQQLQQYFGTTGGGADSGALYVILGGANDINDASLNPATAGANLVAAAYAVNAMVDNLYSAGARNILVGLLPNVGLTPLAISGGPAAAGGATALSQLFNSTLLSLLATTEAASTGLDVDVFDLFSLLNDAVANPTAFGFTNVSTPCKSGPNGFPGLPCANPDEYLFWDSFHPTAAAHTLIAQAALNAIPEPGTVLLFALAVAGLLQVRTRRRGNARPA